MGSEKLIEILESQVNLLIKKDQEIASLKGQLGLKITLDESIQVSLDNEQKKEAPVDQVLHKQLLDELVKLSQENKLLQTQIQVASKREPDAKMREFSELKQENEELKLLIKTSQYDSLNALKEQNKSLEKDLKLQSAKHDSLKKELEETKTFLEKYNENQGALAIELQKQIDLNKVLLRQIEKFQNAFQNYEHFWNDFVKSQEIIKELEDFNQDISIQWDSLVLKVEKLELELKSCHNMIKNM